MNVRELDGWRAEEVKRGEDMWTGAHGRELKYESEPENLKRGSINTGFGSLKKRRNILRGLMA